MSLAVTLHFLPIPNTPIPSQPLIYSRSLWSSIFWIFYINRIIRYLVSGVLLPIFFFYLVCFQNYACCSIYQHFISFFITKLYSIVWIYQKLLIHSLVDGQMSCFHFLTTRNLLETFMYKFFCGRIFISPGDIHLGVE